MYPSETGSSSNQCRRCNRKITDPTAKYGWRCAEKMGTKNNNHLYIELNTEGTKNNKIVYEWDEENIPHNELSVIYKYKEMWLQAKINNNINKMEIYHKQAERIRSKYRMSYEYTDESGITKIDTIKYKLFIENAMIKNGKKANDVPPYIIAGAIASQFDGPAPGPADAIGLLIIVGGFIITKTAIYFAHGKGNPRDLEKDMSKKQKEKFQREIEDFKKGGGMPPDFNVPWEILVEIADEIRKMYK